MRELNAAPRVSVGMLTHNGGDYVRQTVPPVLSWLGGRECIVFDNGSSDGTRQFLQGVPGIRLVASDTNLGCGAGKNAIVRLATGDYILLLDDDVLIEDGGVVADCVRFLESHGEAAFVSVPLLEASDRRTLHYGLFFAATKQPRSLDELQALPFFETGGFTGGLVMCRKPVFESLGGFDSIYPYHIDDYDLSARARLRGWRSYTLTARSAVHLGGGRHADRAAVGKKRAYELCGFLRMVAKNYRLPAALVWIPLATVWIIVKTLRRLAHNRQPAELSALCRSIGYCLRDARDTWRQRRLVQSTRVMAMDTFRRIRPISPVTMDRPSAAK